MKRNYNGLDINFNARMPRRRPRLRRLQPRAHASTTCACRRRATRTARSTATRRDSGIPWQKQFKATVVYPLPWYGISVSAALQSLNGYLIGTAAQAYGGFTAGTGFDSPNGQGTFWQVTPTTRYAANCTGPCTPSALVLPALAASGLANLNVPLVAPETEFTPRINQVDFSVSKRFEFGTFRMHAEARPVQRAQLGRLHRRWRRRSSARATYLQPSVILQGRIIRIGVDVSW